MKTWSFYDELSGLFSTYNYSGSLDDHLSANTPPGMVAIEGRFDHLSERVDIMTGEVVDYQPPQPSSDDEWDETTKRWKLNSVAEARLFSDQQARVELAELDLKLTRYIADKIAGTIDAEGQRRFDEMMARKVILRNLLQSSAISRKVSTSSQE